MSAAPPEFNSVYHTAATTTTDAAPGAAAVVVVVPHGAAVSYPQAPALSPVALVPAASPAQPQAQQALLGNRSGNGEFDAAGREYDVGIATQAKRDQRAAMAVRILAGLSVVVIAYAITVMVRFAAQAKTCNALVDPNDIDGFACSANDQCEFTPAHCVGCDSKHTHQNPQMCGSSCYVYATCLPLTEYIVSLSMMSTGMVPILLVVLLLSIGACYRCCGCRQCCIDCLRRQQRANANANPNSRRPPPEKGNRWSVPAFYMLMTSLMTMGASLANLTPRTVGFVPAVWSGIVFVLASVMCVTSISLMVWKRFSLCQSCCGAEDNFGTKPGCCYNTCCAVDLREPYNWETDDS